MVLAVRFYHANNGIHIVNNVLMDVLAPHVPWYNGAMCTQQSLNAAVPLSVPLLWKFLRALSFWYLSTVILILV
jgi:hypothetical protein